ncbi:MAG: sugar kinase [FCB group bacterium]|nr:sugar kinase [FCB group bacterium]
MKNSKNFTLLVGSIALDSIFTSHGSHENLLGGSTTYALVSGGRFVPTHVVGIVGDDFPESGRQIYKQYAADLTDLKTEPGKTFRWGALYHADQDNRDTMFTELGVFADFDPQLSPVNQQAGLVFLANIHPALQLSVMNQVRNDATLVVDTMNLWIETTREELGEVFKKTTILLINESEAYLLTDEYDLDQAAAMIQAMGPKTVVIKQGSTGSTLWSDNERINMGIYPVDPVVDATGAGDSFGGGFVAALFMGKSFREALALGAAMASFTVEDFGITRLAQATSEEIQKRLTYLINGDWG